MGRMVRGFALFVVVMFAVTVLPATWFWTGYMQSDASLAEAMRYAGAAAEMESGENVLSISGALVISGGPLPVEARGQYWDIAVLGADGSNVTVSTFTSLTRDSDLLSASPAMLHAAPVLPTHVSRGASATIEHVLAQLRAEHPGAFPKDTVVSYHLSALGGFPLCTVSTTSPDGTSHAITWDLEKKQAVEPLWSQQSMSSARKLAEQALPSHVAEARLLAAIGLERDGGSYEHLPTRWGAGLIEIPPDTTYVDGKSPVWGFDFWVPDRNLSQRVTVYGPLQVVLGEQFPLTPAEQAEAATAVIPPGIMDSIDVATTIDKTSMTYLLPARMRLQEHKYMDGVPHWDFHVPGRPDQNDLIEDGYTSMDARDGSRISGWE